MLVLMLGKPEHVLEVAPSLQIAVDESGDPHGAPLFFFHGWPASRLQGAGFSVEARALGLRVISPDRPGIGRSSPQPGRRLLDWPPIVRELARQLGIERFRILAVSGGAPYALATAYALPGMVEAVAVISGCPPLGQAEERAGLLPVYRWLLAAHGFSPRVLGSAFWLARPFLARRPPKWMWPLTLKFISGADRQSLREKAVLAGSFDCHCEAWHGSARGVFADGTLYTQDWGFPLEEVQPPVRLWHGRADQSFPWPLAEAVLRRLPNGTGHFIEGHGHYSLPIDFRQPILEDLLAATAPAKALAS